MNPLIHHIIYDGLDNRIDTRYVNSVGHHFYVADDVELKLQYFPGHEIDVNAKFVLDSGESVRVVYGAKGTGKSVVLRNTRLYPMVMDLVDGVTFEEVVFHEFPTAAHKSEPVPDPPANAEFLLHLLLKGNDQDAIIGDLVERFPAKSERLGKRRANLWFYSEVLYFLWPGFKRIAARTAGLVGVLNFIDWIRRNFF